MKSFFRNKVGWYDRVTKKIYNCDEGTFTWYHEMRHKEQDEKGAMKYADILGVYGVYSSVIWFFVALIAGMGWKSFTAAAALGFLPEMLVYWTLEIDAYIVGTYRWWKG